MILIAPNAMSTLVATSSKTLSANNTTASVPLFRTTGSVRYLRLWGVVTTVLSSAITVAYWRLNDQTAQLAITLATGTTLSSAPVGSYITKSGLAATALVLKSSAAGALLEPAVLSEFTLSSAFDVTQKTGGINTDIEFTYSTTNAPATGAIQFFVEYLALSADGAVTAL